MSNLTAPVVEAALVEKYEDEFGSGFWDELDWELGRRPDTLTVDGVSYELSVVEEDTGGEGHGERVFVVVKVGQQLFRKHGYYASHYGTDWDGSFEEVEAYKKKVTDYRTV